MPVPSTSLTSQFDASVNTKLFKVANGGGSGIHTGIPSDNEIFQIWEKTSGSVTDFLYAPVNGGGSSTPRWRSSSLIKASLGAADFDGVDQCTAYDQTAASVKPISNLITNNKYTVATVFFPRAITLNSASLWANHPVWEDAGGFVGCLCRDNAGTKEIYAYVWDGSAKIAALPISINAPYISIVTLENVSPGVNNLHLILIDANRNVTTADNNGIGNISAISGNACLAFTPFAGFDIQIGEDVTYDDTYAGANLNDLKNYLMDKWLGAAAVASPLFTTVEAQYN